MAPWLYILHRYCQWRKHKGGRVRTRRVRWVPPGSGPSHTYTDCQKSCRRIWIAKISCQTYTLLILILLQCKITSELSVCWMWNEKTEFRANTVNYELTTFHNGNCWSKTDHLHGNISTQLQGKLFLIFYDYHDTRYWAMFTERNNNLSQQK